MHFKLNIQYYWININIEICFGIIAIDNINADIELNNVIVKVKDLNGGGRSALLGYQVGGTATLKNVVVDMPTYLNDLKGYLTAHAGTTIIVENVYCMGANGSLHSNAGNHATLIPSHVKADGTTAAVKDTDYFIYADTAGFKASDEFENLGEDLKALVDKAYEIAD